MSLFLGTLIAFALCGLALGLGVLLGGAPIEAACGRSGTGLPRCGDCPRRRRGECEYAGTEESNAT